MTDLQTLFQVLGALEPDELNQVRAYLDQIQTEKLSDKTPRILGMHPGAIWVSDDFTDPLPDEFWFGEE